MDERAHGQVVKAFGNLLHVSFQGEIRQGEVVYAKIGEVLLKGDRSMPYRHARRALEILHRAGVASVELGTAVIRAGE